MTVFSQTPESMFVFFLNPDVAKIDAVPCAPAIVGLWCASDSWARGCSCNLRPLRGLQRTVSAMAPHLSAQEQDFLRGLLGQGLALVKIHERLSAKRARRDMEAPTLGA